MRLKKNEKLCTVCEVVITRDTRSSWKKFGEQKYCSRKCVNESRLMKRACLYCGEIMKIQPNLFWRGKGKFCSITCSNRDKQKDKTTKHRCYKCGKLFFRRPSRNRGKRVFCSKQCYITRRN